MIERIRNELLPFANEFQAAGREGFRVVKEVPFGGEQWTVRHLQRTPFLFGLKTALPRQLNSFVFSEELFRQNRFVYHSEQLNTDLVFRRKASLGAYGKQPRTVVQYGLFDEPPRSSRESSGEAPRLAACVWDLPKYDANKEVSGIVPFRIYLAKEGTALDDRDWEGDFFLNDEDKFLPRGLGFNPDEDDWDIEDENSETS